MKSPSCGFFLAECDHSIDTIYQSALSKAYSGDGSGVEVINYSLSNLELKYYEKQEIDSSFIDPNGTKVSQRLVKFLSYNVSLTKIEPGILLEVTPLPRSIKGFIDLLLSSSSKITVKKSKFSILELYDNFITNYSIKNLAVKELDVFDIPINTNTFAAISMKSSSDAYIEFTEKYKSNLFSIKRIKMEVFNSGERKMWEVYSTGKLIGCENLVKSVKELIVKKEIWPF